MNMQSPLLIINCKTYGEHTGVLAERIAEAAQKVIEQRKQAGKQSVNIVLAVPATDIHRVSRNITTIAEHVDSETPGAHTGAILPEDVKDNGAAGSLVNHSEDPTALDEIKHIVERLKNSHMSSIVCVKDAKTAAQVAAFAPNYIAMEPPELIGGDISVSTAKPEMITETITQVRTVADIPVLVGAGVKNAEDVRIGCKLGAVGILVASGVTKAEHVEEAIAELASGFD